MISNSENKVRGQQIRTAIIAGLASMAMLPGAVALAESTPANKQGEIAPLCGDKPMRIGLVDGWGNSTWRNITRAEAEDELSSCANVEQFRYSEAGGDQQKYVGDINSLVSQGFNVIVALADFGDAALPAYRKAYRDGVTMVPYFNKLSGNPGQDYAANPYQDQAAVGKIWADWINSAKNGEANILYLGGVPGAPSSNAFMAGIKAGIEPYPGVKLLDENYIVTNWNAADAAKAVAGLVARYPKIDAIITDYGVVTLAAIKAFEQAGLPIPAQLTVASNNELNCRYLADKETDKAWKYLSLDGTTRSVRFAVRAAVADFQGIDNPDTPGVVPFVYIDSEQSMDPICDPEAPLDADFSSGLPEDTLKALFN